MSAPNLPTPLPLSSQIPPLLSTRGGGPRLRGRGRGRGGSHAAINPSQRHDTTIQGTDNDAAVSRLSAVEAGYLEDGFAGAFVMEGGGKGVRRLPIINRGTYTRTTAIDLLVERFLSSSPTTSSVSSSPPHRQQKQIISLGAGTDTRYFRLRKAGKHKDVIYHEIDFPAVCCAKERIVRTNEGVFGAVEQRVFPPRRREDKEENKDNVGPGSPHVEEEITEWELHADSDSTTSEARQAEENLPQTGRYIFHPLDLRQIPSLTSQSSLKYFRDDLPTLLISECCLCYLDVSAASDVLNWFTDRILNLGIILYEPIGADDSFGQMMVENLAVRGITMPTVRKYKSLADQIARLRTAGFGNSSGDGDGEEKGKGGVKAKTVEGIWEGWVDERERDRVNALEGLDEVEEWRLLAGHYAVVWGWRGGRFEEWEEWG